MAVGTFNIYIVQPKLLAEMGVFDPKPPVVLFGDLTQPGNRFEAERARWFVRPDRLSVETRDPEVDCGELVAKTLKALCWTPIMAVGVNLVCDAPAECEIDIPDQMRLPVHPEAGTRTIHLCFPQPQGNVNLQFSRSDKKLTLSTNHHVDFAPLRSEAKSLNDAVVKVCKSFMECRSASERIVKETLNGEITYEQSDALRDVSSD